MGVLRRARAALARVRPGSRPGGPRSSATPTSTAGTGAGAGVGADDGAFESPTDIARVLDARTVDQPSTSWRSRAVLPTVVLVCAGVAGVAIAGGDQDAPGLRFVQAGHWIYNSALGRAFHIDGGSDGVGAEVRIPGGHGPATVVQTDQHGYVLSRDGIVKFGKSDLAVADPVDAPADERPLGLEAAGSAFAVYQDAGKIVRFGEHPVTESVGGPVGAPLVTASGTLWVHRLDGGQLCRLPAGASRMTCTGTTPAGHAGGLTLVGERPMWVDTTADTMRPISKDGLGRSSPLGVDLPESSVIAGNDLSGRIAALEPDSSRLHLVDAAAALAGEAARAPVSAELGSGTYRQLASDGRTLALLDERSGTVLTLDENGERVGSARIPVASGSGGSGGSGEGDGDRADARPVLSRGADSRLYVDSATGEHVMVVRDGGSIETVRVGGKGAGDRTDRPSPPPTTPERKPEEPDKPDRQDQDQQDQRDQNRKQDTERRSERQGDRSGDGSDDEDRQPTEPDPPSRPGAPTDVRGVVGDGRITVRWGAASGNGSAVSSYRLSWSGGSRTVAAGTRQATITGLRNGTGYAVTVRAVNRGGTGPGGVTETLTPYGPADPPPNFWVERIEEEEHMFHWSHPDTNGGDLIGYRIIRDHGEKVKQQEADQDYQDWGGLIEGKDYHFAVRAITRSPDGKTLLGDPAELRLTPGESGEGR